MIVPSIALAVTVAALGFVIYSGQKIRRLQRQTWADIALTEVRNSAAGYYMRSIQGARHCRPDRCLALTCCSYECSQGRCPSIPAEFREPTP